MDLIIFLVGTQLCYWLGVYIGKKTERKRWTWSYIQSIIAEHPTVQIKKDSREISENKQAFERDLYDHRE